MSITFFCKLVFGVIKQQFYLNVLFWFLHPPSLMAWKKVKTELFTCSELN
jgi:hypothetical protein